MVLSAFSSSTECIKDEGKFPVNRVSFVHFYYLSYYYYVAFARLCPVTIIAFFTRVTSLPDRPLESSTATAFPIRLALSRHTLPISSQPSRDIHSDLTAARRQLYIIPRTPLSFLTLFLLLNTKDINTRYPTPTDTTLPPLYLAQNNYASTSLNSRHRHQAPPANVTRSRDRITFPYLLASTHNTTQHTTSPRLTLNPQTRWFTQTTPLVLLPQSHLRKQCKSSSRTSPATVSPPIFMTRSPS